MLDLIDIEPPYQIPRLHTKIEVGMESSLSRAALRCVGANALLDSLIPRKWKSQEESAMEVVPKDCRVLQLNRRLHYDTCLFITTNNFFC